MPITLGSNINSLRTQRTLGNVQESLGSIFERLSSGQRINRASDDAAGLAISESLNTDRRVFNQAIRNLNDGLSVLNIADSTVAELSGIVIRMQELAEQAANGSLSSTQRKSLDAEAQELKDEFFRVSRSADFNGLRLFDGSIENGVRLQAGYGTDGSIFSSLGGVMGDGSLNSPHTYGAGDRPFSVTLGDVNGDGSLDLVTANRLSSDVSLLLGAGDGTFEAALTLAVGSNPVSVVTGDLNGDGLLDLVTGNLSSDDTSILLGNGDGTFTAAQTVSIGDGPRSITLADLDGDGAMDLLSANGSGDDTSVRLGNGDGTFREVQTFEAGNGTESIAVGDLNNDGIPDLVTANFSSDDAVVVLGNGDGTFGGGQTFDANSLPVSVALGDVNGDGTLDLAMANFTSDDVSVLIGNGDGTFQAAENLSTGNLSSSVTFSDLNGDGALDIAVSNYGGDDISVLIGRGDGSFLSVQTFVTGDGPSAIALGDLNGDGVLDLVSSNENSDDATVLLGNTREGIAPILDLSLETQADALQALAPLSQKLDSLSEQRGTIGAFQSRLQSALNTLSATSENYAAAESRIKDADIAFESSQLTRLNILQQAASAVLGQANQQPALALALLR